MVLRNLFLVGFFCILGLLGTVSSSSAQQTISSEGILGDVDDGRRAPVITYSTEVAADQSSAKILADTQIINEEYRRFPIAVDFYVNGKLFSRQYRSVEFPAPLGIDVPQEMAAVPFNFAIVATLMHTNRQFVSVVQGVLTASPGSLVNKLDCVAALADGSLSISGELSNSLTSENKLTGTLSDDSAKAEVSLQFTEGSVSGSVKITETGGTENTYTVSGTASQTASVISSVEAASVDQSLTFNCTTPETANDNTDETGASSPEDASALEPAISGGNSGTGPNGESNFIPLDQVGGLEEVN